MKQTKTEKRWEDYLEALYKIEGLAIDPSRITAKRALPLFVLWLDSFHADDQPRRFHNILKNTILRAEAFGLSITDAHKAIRDHLTGTTDEWESVA